MAKKIISLVQFFLLNLFYNIFIFIGIKNNKNQWVVGTHEIANQINLIRNVLHPSVTVSFNQHKFYNNNYDYTDKYNFMLFKLVYRPILLAYLSVKSTHFFYIWHTGFLINRDLEFKFLKNKNKKIVCLFVGDDIRSPKLTIEYFSENHLDTNVHYYLTPAQSSQYYENEKRSIALSADKYADLIFGAQMDQISYLKSKQLSWVYTYDKNNFHRNNKKFEKFEKIKILHAPSNPLFKGTFLVRAAIKKLKQEGYDFDYFELYNTSNAEVLKHLKSTHIVLNQFYNFGIGLFGVESMANHCAVMQSADPYIEKPIAKDFKDAWMITRYWEVYDNLKYLLDNPKKIKYYADKGYDFAYKNYTYEAAGTYINKTLKDHGVIS